MTLDDPLARYAARMSRQRRWYAAVVTVLVVLIGVFVRVVISRGEISHAHLHSAAVAAPSPSSSIPSPQLSLAWRSTDSTAIGQPVFGGTVITYDAHTVTGRNWLTGAAIWTYTRTDMTICQVVQEGGQTIALYDHKGNCDELSSFDTGTGERSWYRTLDSNTNAINGQPGVAVNAYTLLLSTPTLVQAIDPGGGLDRWDFVEPSGCVTTGTALGSSGVLIAQHCADGNHLLLRDPYVSGDGTTSPTIWRLKNVTAIPVAADDLICAINPATGALIAYQSGDGASLGPVTLTPRLTLTSGGTLRAPTVATSSATDALYLSVGGRSYGIDTGSQTQLWTVEQRGPVMFSGGQLYAATRGGIVEIDATSGQAEHTYAIPEPPAGSVIYPVGTGFLVGGHASAVYR